MYKRPWPRLSRNPYRCREAPVLLEGYVYEVDEKFPVGCFDSSLAVEIKCIQKIDHNCDPTLWYEIGKAVLYKKIDIRYTENYEWSDSHYLKDEGVKPIRRILPCEMISLRVEVEWYDKKQMEEDRKQRGQGNRVPGTRIGAKNKRVANIRAFLGKNTGTSSGMFKELYIVREPEFLWCCLYAIKDNNDGDMAWIYDGEFIKSVHISEESALRGLDAIDLGVSGDDGQQRYITVNGKGKLIPNKGHTVLDKRIVKVRVECP